MGGYQLSVRPKSFPEHHPHSSILLHTIRSDTEAPFSAPFLAPPLLDFPPTSTTGRGLCEITAKDWKELILSGKNRSTTAQLIASSAEKVFPSTTGTTAATRFEGDDWVLGWGSTLFFSTR